MESRTIVDVDMTETDLHITERLRKLLPPLTPEERQQLKENIESDGCVRDPILYWHDGKRNVVVDGMHRWEIVRGTSIPFRTEQMHFANYEEAEVWILSHQLGRRNLLNPTEIRNVRGELYNRLKTTHGGDRKSEKSKCQIETLIGDAATEVAEKAGVSRSTIIRDGDRVETLENLTKSARKVAEQASDKDVKSLAKLSASDQDAVARAVRVGQERTIPDAIQLIGAKLGKGTDAQKTDYGRCPNCAGTKWTEDKFGAICAKCNHPHGEPVGDVDEELPPRPPRNGREPSGASSNVRTPEEEFKIQRSKTIKTAEALMRAFGDLDDLRKSQDYEACIDGCKALLLKAKNWN